MLTLISKLHYQGYETGEFSDVAARSLEETNALIKNYPWEEECAVTSVGLAAAGMVIEDGSANYLKIGNYFHSRYCLYLYTNSGKYFIRIVATIEEALAIADNFFNGKDIQADLSREYDLGIKKHFVSKDFIYKVTGLRILKFMLFTIILTVPFTLLLVLCIGTPLFVFTFFVWLFFCGINWLLFINYFLQSRSLFLKVSEGQNKFLFGTRRSYKEYSKEDIDRLTVYACTGGSRGPSWFSFQVYKILFKNGTEIRFTSLLISSFKARWKFGNVPVTEVRKFFPFSRLEKITDK